MEESHCGNDRPEPIPRRRTSLRRKLAFLIASCVYGAVGGDTSSDPAASSLEDRVKAAFLYNFAKFVEWPARAGADPSSAFVIGIVGDDRLKSALEEAVHGKTVRGRPLLVKRYRPDGSDYSQCHIVFVSRSEDRDLAQILGRLDGQPVLTVGESRKFTRLGGIVNFYIQDNRVRFQIDSTLAEARGLKISSRLLNVAGGGERE